MRSNRTKIGPWIRGTAEHLGGPRIRYTWPCGHSQTVDHSKGPVVKRFGAAAAAFYTRYWKGSGGVNLPACRTCARKAAGPK